MCVYLQADWDEINENLTRAGLGVASGRKKPTTKKKRNKDKGEEGDMDIDVSDGEKENENEQEAAKDVIDAVKDAKGLLNAVRDEEEGEEEIL